MDRSRRPWHTIAVVMAAWLAGAAPVHAQWTIGIEVGAENETNIGRGHFERDIRSAFAATLSASARSYYTPGDRGTFSLSVEAAAASYPQFQGLNHADAGAALAYKHKLGVGLEAPWLSARTAITRLNYKEGIRNGWLYAAGVGAGRRFGEQWDVRVEYGYERRTSDEDAPVVPGISGAVFAQRNRVLSANVDYAWTEATALSLGYTRRSGDVTPTTQRNLQIFEVSTAIAADPAFGSDWFAYRLSATTHAFFVGLSQAMGSRSSLNFGVERQVSYGVGGNDYYNTQSRISFAHQF